MIEIRKILLPTDFSAPSRNAARYAASFAEEYKARIYILHVMEGPASLTLSEDVGLREGTFREEIERSAAEEMKGTLPENSEKKLEVVHLIRHGKPHEEIIGAARELDVDLVVMGTHGRSGLSHILMGRTAERVVRNAPCPVLTVRHPEHEFMMP